LSDEPGWAGLFYEPVELDETDVSVERTAQPLG
jgi:hypothetical protein